MLTKDVSYRICVCAYACMDSCMFMIYLHTDFCIYCCSGSLVIDIKVDHIVSHLKYKKKESCKFFEDLLLHKILALYIKWHYCPISEVYMTTMLVLLIVGNIRKYKGGVVSIGLISILCFSWKFILLGWLNQGRWGGHVARMGDERGVYRVFGWEVQK
jgi:hypothetical protein